MIQHLSLSTAFETTFLALQTYVVVFLLFHDWIPLGRLNNLAAIRSQDALLHRFAQPLTHEYAVGNLWAASYPVRKNLVIDTGFDHGFTSASTHWEGFVGFTYLLPHRLWLQRNSVY